MTARQPVGPDDGEADRPDPDQAAVVAVRAGLAALAEPAVPPLYAARWAAALAAEAERAGPADPEPGSAAGAPIGPARGGAVPARPGRPPERTRRPPAGGTGPRGPRRRAARPAAVVTALLGVLVAAGALWPRPADDGPGIDLVAAGMSALGVGDAGPLADPDRRAGCLRAVGAPGVDPAGPLLGGSRVELRGRPGVLLVLGSGRRGVFRVLVVDPDCGPGRGTLIDAATAGGR